MWKAVVVVVCLGFVMTGYAEPSEETALSARALQFFAQVEDANFDAYLKRVRLPPVAPEFRTQVLARLPQIEIVSPSRAMSARLASLTPLLQYHKRQAALDIRIVNTPQALVSVQGRAVLLLSENIFRVLRVEELQAVVAHELGHEYFWGELMEARQQKNYDRMRELELRCDGIAVIALERLGIDATHLISALASMRAFNARVGATDAMPYPRERERVAFIRAMRQLAQTRAINGRVSARK
ncbi:MAG: hypothetical protein ACKV2V_17250 [Blastocatellia bacterium]